MGYKITGGVFVLIGALLIAAGIAYGSSATERSTAPKEDYSSVDSKGEINVEVGVYCDVSGGYIELFGDGTFVINGSERQEYKLKVWENFPATDEASGKITLTDIYYLGTNLDGGVRYTEKIMYDYENSTLVYGDVVYRQDG